MSTKRTLVLLGCVALANAALAPALCLYTVDRTEFVYLTQFGRLITTHDGAVDAGLHFKWPWPIQSAQRIDRRLQYFDLPGAELLTRDAAGGAIDRTLTIDAYVCWRIPDARAADLFLRTVGSVESAQQVLSQRIASELGAAVAEMELDDLIHPDSARIEARRAALHARLLVELRESAKDEYGIEVVDIRLRRTNHPQAVREAIFERIRSERARKVAEYQSEGQRLADDIRSRTAREVAQLKAEAEGRSIELRGRADAVADSIRSDAQARDPQFYAFLRKLEDYQRILGDNKTTLLLSTQRGMFGTLFDPPAPGEKKKEKK